MSESDLPEKMSSNHYIRKNPGQQYTFQEFTEFSNSSTVSCGNSRKITYYWGIMVRRGLINMEIRDIEPSSSVMILAAKRGIPRV